MTAMASNALPCSDPSDPKYARIREAFDREVARQREAQREAADALPEDRKDAIAKRVAARKARWAK